MRDNDEEGYAVVMFLRSFNNNGEDGSLLTLLLPLVNDDDFLINDSDLL